jgi:hypothetical protein
MKRRTLTHPSAFILLFPALDGSLRRAGIIDDWVFAVRRAAFHVSASHSLSQDWMQTSAV